MAISGFMTEANSFGLSSLKHKVMNAVDACNAGAMASDKGLTLVDQCLPDAETAAKHKAGAAAFWGGHCQGKDATTNQSSCEIALSASCLPEGFVCDDDAASNPDQNVLANCFYPAGLKQNGRFAWVFWHHADNCKAQGKKKANSKFKKQCAAIKGAYAKIDTMKEPAAPTPPPPPPTAEPAAEPAAAEPAAEPAAAEPAAEPAAEAPAE